MMRTSQAAQPALWTIVPAAGVGSRMGAQLPKQYLTLLGRPLIEHTLDRLLSHARISSILLVLDPDDRHWLQLPSARDPRIERVNGGSERCHSVLNALLHLSGRAHADDWVLVHDVARPCLRHADLDRLLDQLWQDAVGGLLGVPVADTLKRTNAQGQVIETVDRHQVWRAYTPQMFRYGLLRQALESALADGRIVTDEASAVEAANRQPRMVAGHADNIKVTRPGDLALAELYLRQIDRDEQRAMQ